MKQPIGNIEPVAIIGIGGIFPDAPDIPTFWKNIIGKKNSITEVPPERWDSRLYYDSDRSVPDKTYSKIGGFVTGFKFDPLPLRIPPGVAKQMDAVQQFAVAATAQALKDSGYDKKPFDSTRTAVIFGNAMGGPKKEATDLRVYTAEVHKRVTESKGLSKLDEKTRQAVADEIVKSMKEGLGPITEDTMPGELSNVIAGRVANVFNLNGPNFTVDAACASALAAIAQAVNGLRLGDFDMALTGGIDQMMAAPAYVKFSKIGALSPDGSRPFDAGANGFVMGEGAGVLVLKRLGDAAREGDKVYALIRAIGASSDGRGKGITAPNPKGQKLAIERVFAQLDYGPEDVGLIEAHGTSTRVGDLVEVQTAAELFKSAKPRSIGLGSIKSQIGHLKAAAGVAGMIKAALALHHKTLPPSINFKNPNPGIDWDKSPFFVVTEPREWVSQDKPRRANVSAFGFGGTNFHVAVEEATPQTLSWKPAPSASQAEPSPKPDLAVLPPLVPALGGEPFFVRGSSAQEIFDQLEELKSRAPAQGPLTRLACEWNSASRAAKGDFLLTIAAESGPKLAEKIDLALKSRGGDIWAKTPAAFKPKSIHAAKKTAERPKVGFMFPGQGLQYVDMLKDMAAKYQVVADTFAEADEVMRDRTGPLSEMLWTRGGETPEKLAAMQARITQTQNTQPVVLTADIALLRLLRAHGVDADMVYGHSLGEYGAHVAAGVMEFRDALIAVSMRAKEMAHLHVDDNGKMASVSWPIEKIEPVLKEIPGYIIAANKNCPIQTVLSGDSAAIDEAVRRFTALGAQAQPIEVSHAFHSKIVHPARKPYGEFLDKVEIRAPRIPILSNLTGDLFPKDVKKIKEMMVEHMTSPVEFIRQTRKMYEEGVRVFVELGPKRALSAFVQTTLEDKRDVHIFASNHPKRGGIQEFNDLLSRLESVGVEIKLGATDPSSPRSLHTPAFRAYAMTGEIPAEAQRTSSVPASELPGAAASAAGLSAADAPRAEKGFAAWDVYLGPVVVSGIAAGTPGEWDKVFREEALDGLLRGQNLISRLSQDDLEKQLDKNVIRLIKSEDGNHRMEKIQSAADVIHLAATAGSFDLAKEFGFKESIAHSMDRAVRLGVAAGILALRDAGIPLVRTYKKTTLGGLLPTGWALPESLRDETGIIFASAFPCLDSVVDEISRYLADKFRHKPLRELQRLFESLLSRVKDSDDRASLHRWYAESFVSYMERHGEGGRYEFSRDFLLRALPIGHSQLAQHIGARGPGVQINAACASTTEAVGIAEDWLRLSRARRVIVISADDIMSPRLREFWASGFLAAGAATTKEAVSEAALPFDRRRHGLIVGMGAVGLVIEVGALVSGRGMRPLVEILSTQYENSAFHATRLDVDHVADVMGRLIGKAERRFGLDRRQIASRALFMSHETYTPARGGSASAEVEALRRTFGADAAKIVVTNTKGYHGHTMGASIEDPSAIRALVTGIVPPIANYREPDPELAGITLSRGGEYDLDYAIRLGAGFGSQIAMTLSRRAIRKGEARIADPARRQAWLREISAQPSPELEVVQNTLRVKEAQGSSPQGGLAAPFHQPAQKPQPPARVSPAGLRGTETPQRQTPKPPAVQAAVALVEPKAAFAPAADGGIRQAPSAGHSADGTAREENDIRAAIVALVGEKTGYPSEMLDPNLDMEADLGIDTVKQAELFGLIREKYGIPRRENLSLKDYPTLNHVVRFVLESAVGSPAAGAPAAVPAPASAASAAPISAAAPAPAEAAAGATAREENSIRAEVVSLVGEKTGYPAEMLNLDLDMEADLGIDTVKQAEIFGLIREKYGIPRQEGISLKDYPTLRHVISFVLRAKGAPALSHNLRASAAEPVEQRRPAEAAASEEAPRFDAWRLEAYPRPAKGLIPQLSKERAVVILASDPKTAEPFAAAVEKAGGLAVAVKPADWDAAADADEQLRKALKDKKAGGIFDVTALDLPDFDDMTPAAFEKNYRKTARSLFLSAQCLREDLVGADSRAWILVVTRLGGRHGSRADKALQPLAGTQTGLAKALGREFDRATVRAVDFSAQTPPAEMAAAALSEIGSDDPRREVGYVNGERHALQLLRLRRQDPAVRKISQNSVFLITGGAGALASELAKEIASRYKCRIALLDLLPLPKEATAWARYSEEELKDHKSRMWEEMKKDPSRKVTPVMLEKEFGKVRYAIKLHRGMEELIRIGSKILYLAADLSDAAALAKAVKSAVKEYGQLDFIIHTAGLEESKLLADKKVENYDRVVRPKAHGAFNLLKAVPKAPGQRWGFFSSVVARFGNIGQADYATANDFLVKLAAWMNAQKRSAVAFDLTAFAEVGMATRGGVQDFLKSLGVDFMPPKIGLGLLLDELALGSESEVVLAGALGKMDSDGLMSEAAAPAQAAHKAAPPSQMHDQVLVAQPGRFILEKTFSLEGDPWLRDHSIDGIPYVPGVMGLELFAEAASKVLGEAPGALEEVRFALPIKLLRNRPASVRVEAKKAGLGTALSIESDFISPAGVKLGGPRTHFLARAGSCKGDGWEGIRKPALPNKGRGYAAGKDVIYRLNFHGPSFQVLDGMYVLEETELLAQYRRPKTALWPRGERALIWNPLLIEGVFQTCGFRDLNFIKKLTLPDLVESVELFERGPVPEEMFTYAVYRGASRGEGGADMRLYDAVAFDESYRVWVRLRGYRMIAQA
ncbi:MAG: SDR family NAD(P)-dependent oxidoreductase [Elusimicrobia bacterium]|nr:SDR family NAD(P)-dependent oxidoreductase [Elusimicrobiota bacterium]